MKYLHRAGLAAGLAMTFGSAWALPCDSALLFYQSYISANNAAGAADLISDHPECFGGGQLAAHLNILNSSFTLSHAIANAMAMRRVGGGPLPVASIGLKGMAAGGGAGMGKWNAWSNLNLNDTHQAYTTSFGDKVKNKTDVDSVVVGADYNLSSTAVLGISGAFDNSSKSSSISGAAGSDASVKGYVIAPYLSMQLSNTFSLDASAGTGRGDYDTSDNTSAHAKRWFAAANLSYSRWFDNIQLTGRAGFLHGVEDYGDIKNSATGVKFAGTDARNTIDQIRLGAQVGYWMNGVMPFASLGYTNDVRRKTTQFGSPNNPVGRDAWVWGLGMNFYSVKDGVTGGVTYTEETGRSHQTNRGLMANINIRF